MSYDSSKQYRCDIVRTRAKKNIDDLLPAYARIISDLCPCLEEDFIDAFNAGLRTYLTALGSSVDIKALNNHRTETAKTLFGMYYVDERGIVNKSERTEKYLMDGDQPAFFKDVCYKLQFPNGMTKNPKLKDRLAAGIKIYPYRFLLSVLQCALNEGVTLNIREIGYYILNSLDVLTGNSSPVEVVKKIKDDQVLEPHKDINTHRNRPWDWEHIEGMVNYLVLANLIIVKGKKSDGHERTVSINPLEAATIKIFTANVDKPLEFDIEKYKLGTAAERKHFQLDWDKYNARLSDQNAHFYTSPSALGITFIPGYTATAKKPSKTTAIGKAGEAYVYKYELERVAKVDSKYITLVKDRSNERGIGYDIESIYAKGALPETKKYIEVKTTTRVTPPSKKIYFDAVNVTRNEWTAAHTYPNDYYIYRVYLTKGEIIIYTIGNVVEKEAQNVLAVSAPMYEMKFDISTVGLIDEQITL